MTILAKSVGKVKYSYIFRAKSRRFNACNHRLAQLGMNSKTDREKRLATFRSKYDYKVECEFDFSSNLVLMLLIITSHITFVSTVSY